MTNSTHSSASSPGRAAADSRAAALVAAVLAIVAVLLASWNFWLRQDEPYDVDSKRYIAVAEGRIAEVQAPFTNRVMGPWLARQISTSLDVSVETAFLAINVASLLVLVTAGALVVLHHTRSAGLALAIIFTPRLLALFREIYLPDGLHAALLAVFFLALTRGRWWWAVPLLFFMQVTRESTILVTFFFVIIALVHRRWKVALVALLVTAAGMAVVKMEAKKGRPNIHNTGTGVYMLAKAPANFLTNVCGVRMWTNTLAANNPKAFPDEPIFKINAPGWAPVGAIREIGVYKIQPRNTLYVASFLLTLLGVMPSVALAALWWRRLRMRRDKRLSACGQTSLAYGGLSYLLGTSLGAALNRLIYYGWPLSWIAAPELLARYFDLESSHLRKLAWLQALACWTPALATELGLPSVETAILAIAVALPCHIATMRMLRQRRVEVESPSQSA